MHQTEIEEFTKSIWNTMLGLMVQGNLSENAPAVAQAGDGRVYVGRVDVSGGWQGAVVVQFNHALGRRAAAKMFECDASDVTDEEVEDVVGELVNMIGGNLKSLLPGPSNLSTPKVTAHEEGHPFVPPSPVVTQVTFDCDQQQFRVLVLRED